MRKAFVLTSIMMSFYLILILASSQPASAQGINDELRPMGLILMTSDEIELFRKSHNEVGGFAPNAIALERINAARAKKGLSLLSPGLAVPVGQELRSPGESPGMDAVYESLPIVHDNSTSKYFPPIGNQLSLGSCTTFATTYYQLSYMVAFVRHNNDPNWIVNVNPPDYTKIFSPRWTYNFQRNSENKGSPFWGNYDVLQFNGACRWSTFPYNGVDYRSWCTAPGPWEEAIYQRIKPIRYILDINLDEIKNALVTGYILTFGTYVSSWQYATIKDNPNSTEDDLYIGKGIAYWVNGQSGGHAMTIVGYNDAIWTDINKNRKIDTGEIGAFRIANSWGNTWKEAGFTWLAYDALRAVSAVSGGPSLGRVPAFPEGHVYAMELEPTYIPKLLAQFTLNHAKRNQLLVNLGISDTTASEPTISLYPGVLNLASGAYAFDGTTTACDGTFVFDFTDILLPDNVPRKYYLGVFDSKTGSSAILKDFALKIGGSLVGDVNSPPLPYTIDGEVKYASINYTVDSGTLNYPPLPVITASPTFGPPPLTVNFDGIYSTDSDGYIVKHIWFFGDTGSSPIVAGNYNPTTSHTYNDPGIYAAKLSVTDNDGVTSSAVVIIAAKYETLGEMHVNDIIMSAQKKGVNVIATAKVTIFDALGNFVPEATVSGNWTGATTQTNVSGITNASGIATINSNSVKNPTLSFTFTVTDVIKSNGWIYNSAANVETSDSVLPPSGAPPKSLVNSLQAAYPSPSNPDVWIPFTLAQAEHVVITIYDATGRLVRTLNLDQKPAGAYMDKSKAAYWDGKNEAGESITSGIYFYAIKAGDFTATKKLLIVR